jgi:hypothetical protein
MCHHKIDCKHVICWGIYGSHSCRSFTTSLIRPHPTLKASCDLPFLLNPIDI